MRWSQEGRNDPPFVSGSKVSVVVSKDCCVRRFDGVTLFYTDDMWRMLGCLLDYFRDGICLRSRVIHGA